MRILIATVLYPPETGGPATYTKLLEERLPARGIGVSVLPFRAVRSLPKGIRHLVYVWKCLMLARKVDVIFAQDTVSVGFPAALAAHVLGKKFIVRVPGDYAWEQASGRWGVMDSLDEFQPKSYGWRVGVLRALQKFVVRSARSVVVPSEYMRHIVSGWGVVPVLIYNGIALPVPVELPKNRSNGFLVVTVGRKVPWKGFEGLARVIGREPSWHLFVADGLPRAQALGWVKTADVFVLNSTYEGLSHVLLEAMSLGTPIVATAVGGNPELITDGIEGLLIPPKDDDALHIALKKIEQDRETARARAEEARIKVARFSIDTTLGKLIDLLQTI